VTLRRAAAREEPFVQLATRIPKSLHRVLKLHCVETEVQLRDFVIRALEERLAKRSRRTRKPRAPERR